MAKVILPVIDQPAILENTARGSPTRESHIETLNITEVTAMKEEPGSFLSDVSIDSDADESPEEQTIKIKLRQKIEMLSENTEILKRLSEEASILEKKHTELLTDINTLAAAHYTVISSNCG